MPPGSSAMNRSSSPGRSGPLFEVAEHHLVPSSQIVGQRDVAQDIELGHTSLTRDRCQAAPDEMPVRWTFGDLEAVPQDAWLDVGDLAPRSGAPLWIGVRR